MDFDTFKIRCSAIGKIMGKTGLTEAQVEQLDKLVNKPKARTVLQEEEMKRLIEKRDNPELPLTCRRYLVEAFRERKYKRRNDFSSKFTEKGNAVELDSINLLALYRGEAYAKNSGRGANGFIMGEWDILKNKEVIDIKSSWSLWTFPTFLDKSIDPDYFYQCQGYMDLTGAEKATIAYCLVNAPAILVDDEKRRLGWKMGVISSGIETPEYIEACKLIERNMIFDRAQFLKDYPDYPMHETDWKYDIAPSERVFEQSVERNDKVIQSVYDRVKMCREWMKENLTNF